MNVGNGHAVTYTVFFTVTDRFWKTTKYHNTGMSGSHSSRIGTRQDFFPLFFYVIGMGWHLLLWEWDRRGLKIHSRVTLYYTYLPTSPVSDYVTELFVSTVVF